MALANTQAGVNGYNAAVRDYWMHRNFMYLGTQRSPFFQHLKMKGRIQPSGYGTQMREPLEVPVTTGPQLQGISNAYAPVQPQPMTGFISATYVLALYGINISWTDYQMMEAGSDVEMVNWQQSILKNATNRIHNKLMDDLWAAPELSSSWGTPQQMASIRFLLNGGGTVATDGGASPSAQASQSQIPLVSATGAGTTGMLTVGGIPRNAVGGAYWCTPIIYGSPVTPGSTSLTMLTLNDIYEEAFQDGYEPDYISCPTALFSKLQNLLTVGGSNGGLVLSQGDTAKFGFSYLNFRGAKIVPDRRCPTSGFSYGTSTQVGNHMFVINSNMVTLRMSGNKPKFKEVVEAKPIHEEFGTIGCALTGQHLGNVHAVACQLTQ